MSCCLLLCRLYQKRRETAGVGRERGMVCVRTGTLSLLVDVLTKQKMMRRNRSPKILPHTEGHQRFRGSKRQDSRRLFSLAWFRSIASPPSCTRVVVGVCMCGSLFSPLCMVLSMHVRLHFLYPCPKSQQTFVDCTIAPLVAADVFFDPLPERPYACQARGSFTPHAVRWFSHRSFRASCK